MNNKAKSSRKRMDARIKGFVKSKGTTYYRLYPKTQEEVQCANRPLRRSMAARKRKNAHQS